MINNRRHIVILILITLASVFFVSCGQPEYCTLNNIYLKGNKNTNGISFYFDGSDSDLLKVKDGPGLLLCYFVSDLPVITDSQVYINEFGSKYGNSSGLGKNVVRPQSNDSILDNDKKLYAFTKNGNQVSAWKYFSDLGTSGYSISSYFKLSSEDNRIFVESSKENFYLLDTQGKVFEEGDYVHIFGAFTCQSTNNNVFSNIYWSNLVYLGVIQI